MSIGERIESLRTQKKLSQGEIAQSLGVTRQAISKWENDLSSPDTIHLIKLADILDTEVEYLATGKKPVYEEPAIIVNMVKKVDKIVEKTVEKPVIRKVVRIQYRRDPVEYVLLVAVSLFVGFFLGALIF